MCFHDRFADGQTHAHALRLRSHQRFEHLLDAALVESQAVVRHLDDHSIVVARLRTNVQNPATFWRPLTQSRSSKDLEELAEAGPCFPLPCFEGFCRTKASAVSYLDPY
jgi:hypothetical protein